MLDRWLTILVELEQNCISPFSILTSYSSVFVEIFIGYSPPSSHLGPFVAPVVETPRPVDAIRLDMVFTHAVETLADQIGQNRLRLLRWRTPTPTMMALDLVETLSIRHA